LVYATSPRGACHNQSDYYVIDMGQVLTELGMDQRERLGGSEKARNVAIHQDWRTISNSLVLCLFANVPVQSLLDLVNAACGYDMNLAEFLRTGERGWNIKRAINNRLGLTAENDHLPNAFLKPYNDQPPGADNFIPDIKNMLAEYYIVRGWDHHTGYPSKDKLKSLDLNWIAEDLW